MKRTKHGLSCFRPFSMNMGKLIPINWYEVLPGDTFQQQTSVLVRVSPLANPVMHPVSVRIHHWFCPLRKLWDSFEDFITGGPDGNDDTVPPFITLGTVAESSLLDYLGVKPHAYASSIDVSALAPRAYNWIFNNHYRDQDLVSEVALSTEDGDSGADTTTSLAIQNVSWPKDAFTTARPWAQKGTGVTIPLGDEAEVKYYTGLSRGGKIRNQTDDGLSSNTGLSSGSSGQFENDAGTSQKFYDPNETLYADLSAATGIDIADLRLALAIQRYQEARSNYGSRYVEYLRSLGVRSSDARLDLPEYLGGGRQLLQFSEVLSTDGANTGDMAGHGIMALRSNRFRRFFEEHGIVMSLMSVVPKPVYEGAMHKQWFRTVKEDYFQRELVGIGDQAITNKEVMADHSTPDGVFGYQSRYWEYGMLPNSVAGEFRSTLYDWHMARIFGSDVTLNQSFTDCVPTDRIYKSTASDQLYVMANHSIQARRMVPRFAKPRTF